MSLDVQGQKRTETITEWVVAGPYAVAVDVVAVIFPERPNEPYLAPETVRRLEEIERWAEAGDVDALSKVGKVFQRTSPPPELLVFGYDPGGATTCANGVAFLDWGRASGPAAFVDSFSSVDDVIEWLRARLNGRVLDGAGIDSYLSWSTARCGTRPMDSRLRGIYPDVKKSVLDSNSADGSMAIQGMALAMKLRETWARIRLNETHPKVLFHALTRRQYEYGPVTVKWLMDRFSPPLTLERPIQNEHEWDALFSAWATWKGLVGSWRTDLLDAVPPGEKLLFPAGPVTYYWPEEVR